MFTPYYTDNYVTLYHGDCREITCWLDADVLITDPPYGLGGRLSQRGFSGDEFGIQEWDNDVAVRDEILALWGTERPSAVFGSPRLLHLGVTHREAPLIWDKGNVVGMGDTTFPWRPSYELIYVNGSPWTGQRGPAVLRYPHHTSKAREVGHPTPKPIGLMADLISSSSGVIADPFAGSGSTLIAAAMLGRRAIGIELEERYAKTAAQRLSQGILISSDTKASSHGPAHTTQEPVGLWD